VRIAVTGATGFVGRRLCEVARIRGHDVLRLSRFGSGDRRWDPMSEPAPLEGADAVVHLAGEPLTGARWTRTKMARIRSSRILGTLDRRSSFRPRPWGTTETGERTN
jgi:NAD dependent epimerase/dehydratase family enzyme